MLNKDSVFDKIDKHLKKKGHVLLASLYLNNFNGHNIYVRFDYVSKMSVYKVVWVDLAIFSTKNMEDYFNTQIVTKFVSLKMLDCLLNLKVKPEVLDDPNVYGDRVEFITYLEERKEYVFSRFLPKEWKELIEPLAYLFSYLPRGMDVILNEIFAIFDGTTNKYNYMKPVKFSIFEDDYEKVFKKTAINSGIEYVNMDSVKFLEKREGKYIGAVKGAKGHYSVVVLEELDDGFAILWCSCGATTYCKHIYAVIDALRNKKFNNFYKIKNNIQDDNLLDKLAYSNYLLCIGIKDDKLLVVGNNGHVEARDIVVNGKVIYDVIEDDDDLTLSKKLDEYRIK